MAPIGTRLDRLLAAPWLLGTSPKRARHLRCCRVSLLELLWPIVVANAAALLRCSLSILCLVALLGARYLLHGSSTTLYSWTVMENHISIIPDLQTRVLSYAQTHFWYVFKLLYPRHLCFDYGYRCMPTVDSLYDPR